MWDLVKVRYQPVPFRNYALMDDVFRGVEGRLAIHGASRHVRTEPPVDSYVATTRTSVFRKFHSNIAMIMPNEWDEDLMQSTCDRTVMEARFMAHALRTRNKIQTDESKMIKLNTVMMDIADFEVGAVDTARTPLENKSMELRRAAQNHLTMVLALLEHPSSLRRHWDAKSKEEDPWHFFC